ncbi:MAG TPA: DUF4142 domain-containing protein [Chryseosolibacter sp.]
MVTKLRTFALLGCCIAAVACDNDDDNKRSLATTDKTFVQDAARSNLTEIEFGALAATKGNTEMVREFGQHMVDEHTTAQNELRDLANDYGNVDWPDGLDAQHQQIREQLMETSGYSFDSLYMNSQVMDHQMTLEIFNREISGGTEQQVKTYAQKYQPHIQMHHEKADSVFSVLLANPTSD